VEMQPQVKVSTEMQSLAEVDTMMVTVLFEHYVKASMADEREIGREPVLLEFICGVVEGVQVGCKGANERTEFLLILFVDRDGCDDDFLYVIRRQVETGA